MKLLTCDLHNLRFQEAMDTILETLRQCWKKRIEKICIIHGYHGHILKDYIESKEFLEEMDQEGFYLEKSNREKKRNNNPGESIFVLVNLKNIKRRSNQKININLREKSFSLKKIPAHKKMNLFEVRQFFS